MIGSRSHHSRIMSPLLSAVKVYGRLAVGRRRRGCGSCPELSEGPRYNAMTPLAKNHILQLLAGRRTDALARDNVKLRLLAGADGAPVGPEWLSAVQGPDTAVAQHRSLPSSAMQWTFEDATQGKYTANHCELWVGRGDVQTTGYKFADVGLTGLRAKAGQDTHWYRYTLEMYSESNLFQSVAMGIMLDIIAGKNDLPFDADHLLMRPFDGVRELGVADLPPDQPLPIPNLNEKTLLREFTAAPGVATGRWARVRLKYLNAAGQLQTIWDGPTRGAGGSGGMKSEGDADRWGWLLSMSEGESNCPQITSIEVDNEVVRRNQPVTVTVAATNFDMLSVDHDIGEIRGTTFTFRPQQEGVNLYTMTAEKAGCQDVSKTFQVTVVEKPVIELFEASPTVVSRGSSTTLRWRVRGADPGGISIDQGIGVQEADRGTFEYTPRDDVRLTMRARNAQGVTESQPLFIDVVDVPTLTCGVSAQGRSSAQEVGVANEADAPTFVTRPNTTVTLHYAGLGGNVALSILPQPGARPHPVGTVDVAIGTDDVTFAFTATNENGTITKYVKVTPTTLPVVELTATPPQPTCGEISNIGWEATNADTVYSTELFPNPPHTSSAMSGSVGKVINGLTVFNIKAYKAATPDQAAPTSIEVRCVPDPQPPVITTFTFQVNGHNVESAQPGAVVTMVALVTSSKDLTSTEFRVPAGDPDATGVVAARQAGADDQWKVTGTITAPDEDTSYQVAVSNADGADQKQATLRVSEGPAINCAAINANTNKRVEINGTATISLANAFNAAVTHARARIGDGEWTGNLVGETNVAFQNVMADADVIIEASDSSTYATKVTCTVSVTTIPIIDKFKLKGPSDTRILGGGVTELEVNPGTQYFLDWLFRGGDGVITRGTDTLVPNASEAGLQTFKAPTAPGVYTHTLSVTRGEGPPVQASVRLTVTQREKPDWGETGLQVRRPTDADDTGGQPTGIGSPPSQAGEWGASVTIDRGDDVEVQWPTLSEYTQIVLTLGSQTVTRRAAQGSSYKFQNVDVAETLYATPKNGNVAGDVRSCDVEIRADETEVAVRIGTFEPSRSPTPGPGQASILEWTIAAGTQTHAQIQDGQGRDILVKSATSRLAQIVRPEATTVYTLTVWGTHGPPVTATCTVTVAETPDLAMRARPPAVPVGGGDVTISWTIRGVGITKAVLKKGSEQYVIPADQIASGSKTYNLRGPTVFSLEATNAAGTNSTSPLLVPEQRPPGGGR